MSILLILLLLCGCTGKPAVSDSSDPSGTEKTTAPTASPAFSTDMVFGADVSSVIAQERSGVIYHGFDGQAQDLLKTLRQSGMDYIRVRLWVDPYDKDGNGYGGGNCDLANAVAIGRRARENGMKLLVDFHYSDFWADPGKQQVPKAWAGLSFGEKRQAMEEYTSDALRTLQEAGVDVGMVQIGNETNSGFCGEWTPNGQYTLMASAASAVRAVDPEIRIVVHYTNPEKGGYSTFARYLQQYEVDYDIFASSYYPYWHGTVDNLAAQLSAVADGFGKDVMVAETSWIYTSRNTDDHHNSVSAADAYPVSVQGQKQAITALVRAMNSLGDRFVGVFYWEPAWIAVPGENWQQRSELWERWGSGWASSYASEYDPEDAGKYYGGSACDNQALFDENGYPLESLKTFLELRG